MDTFRWVLLLIGVGIFILIYLYSRRKASVAEMSEEKQDYFSESLVDDEMPSIMINKEEEQSLDSLANNMRITADDDKQKTEQDRLVIFYLVEKDGGMLSGASIVDALEKAGMRYGDMKIYHFHDAELPNSSQPVFSVANIVDPGYFDLVTMSQISTPGLAIFMNLPGPVKGPRAFDLMLSAIEELKSLLPLTVRDKSQEIVSKQSLMHIREELVEHDRKSALEARAT